MNNDTSTLAQAAEHDGYFDTADLTIASWLSSVTRKAVSFPWTPGKSPLPRLTAAQKRELGAGAVTFTDDGKKRTINFA